MEESIPYQMYQKVDASVLEIRNIYLGIGENEITFARCCNNFIMLCVYSGAKITYKCILANET